MKIRKGFVSNSSSSSFVVAFPKGFVVTEENVCEHLYGSEPVRLEVYDYAISSINAAKVITSEMQRLGPNNQEEIDRALQGYISGCPNFESFRGPGREIDWGAYELARDAHRQKVSEDLKKEFADYDVYCFEFSDNDGETVLEHGPTFDNVPHLRISNH